MRFKLTKIVYEIRKNIYRLHEIHGGADKTNNHFTFCDRFSVIHSAIY